MPPAPPPPPPSYAYIKWGYEHDGIISSIGERAYLLHHARQTRDMGRPRLVQTLLCMVWSKVLLIQYFKRIDNMIPQLLNLISVRLT